MQQDTYKTAYPKYGSLVFPNNPVGTKTAEIGKLFDQIQTLVIAGAVTPEAGHAAVAGLQYAWGGIFMALNGKVSN